MDSMIGTYGSEAHWRLGDSLVSWAKLGGGPRVTNGLEAWAYSPLI